MSGPCIVKKTYHTAVQMACFVWRKDRDMASTAAFGHDHGHVTVTSHHIADRIRPRGIGLSRPRIARKVALARKRVQRRRPRVLGIYFLAEDPKTPAKSVSRRPAGADRGARAILEPRASFHEQCIVVTSLVPRRFRPSPHHSFVSLAR